MMFLQSFELQTFRSEARNDTTASTTKQNLVFATENLLQLFTELWNDQ